MDNIARQKLLVHAVRHFGLNEFVTIQYFKDGDVLTELDNYDAEVVITNTGVENGPIPDEDDIISYFESNGGETPLDSVLATDDYNGWLEDYYESRDAIPLKQVHLNGMQIHYHLAEISRCCSINTEVDQFPSNLVSVVNDVCLDMKRKIIKHPIFPNVTPYVAEFGRVATTILSAFKAKRRRARLSRISGLVLPNERILLRNCMDYYIESNWVLHC